MYTHEIGMDQASQGPEIVISLLTTSSSIVLLPFFVLFILIIFNKKISKKIMLILFSTSLVISGIYILVPKTLTGCGVLAEEESCLSIKCVGIPYYKTIL